MNQQQISVKINTDSGKTTIEIGHSEPIDQIYLAAVIIDLGNKILKQGLGFEDERMLQSIN